MMPSHTTVALAGPSGEPAVASAFPMSPDDLAGALPVRPDDLAATLPPPPQKVVLDNTYGPVTVDHAAHLARRTHCNACHLSGRISKIGRYTPREAHQSCRGCHVTLARGPTECRQCHVKKPEPLQLAKPAEGAAPAGAVALAQPDEARRATSALDAYEDAAAWESSHADASQPEYMEGNAGLRAPARRTIFAGVSLGTSSARSDVSPGFLAGTTLWQGRLSLTELLHWSGNRTTLRSSALLAAGRSFPLRPRWTGYLQAVGGVNANGGQWATLIPGVGGRTGVEFNGGLSPMSSVELALTVVTDVGQHVDPAGRSLNATTMTVSAIGGFEILRGR
jgi:hypothetical protein